VNKLFITLILRLLSAKFNEQKKGKYSVDNGQLSTEQKVLSANTLQKYRNGCNENTHNTSFIAKALPTFFMNKISSIKLTMLKKSPQWCLIVQK
jgi:hypothetical protein